MPSHSERSHAPTPVEIARISQEFSGARVLSDISLAIAPGETLALLGPSGCGKTTLLRLLAGLARPTGGAITIGTRVVADARTRAFIAPEARNIGMVFQDYALWPHMSVAKNVAFPLEMRGLGRAERDRRTHEALALVGLDALADRQPGTLSGGQQQRVALARAIVARPALILFDEPLSNLDRELRESLVIDIAALLRGLEITAVYVTHDHAEAFAIADRVAILSGGDLLQVAQPETLVAAPASVAVAEFLKLGLVLAAETEHGEVVITPSPDRPARRLRPPSGFANGSRAGHLFVPRGGLRPAGTGEGALRATALHSVFRGEGYAVQLRLETGALIDVHSRTRIGAGLPVDLLIAWDRARWFPAAHSN